MPRLPSRQPLTGSVRQPSLVSFCDIICTVPLPFASTFDFAMTPTWPHGLFGVVNDTMSPGAGALPTVPLLILTRLPPYVVR